MRRKANTRITAKNMLSRSKKGYKPMRSATALEKVQDYIQLHAMLGFREVVSTAQEDMYPLLTDPSVQLVLKKAGFAIEEFPELFVSASVTVSWWEAK